MANTPKNIKKEISRNYIAKDFDQFRLDLQQFAQTYYPDNMQDFSESSLGGLLVDLAAYVGDSMSYYTDHQFRELDPITAVETQNIQRMAQNVGIKIPGAAPSSADVSFFILVPSQNVNGQIVPNRSILPIIRKDTVLTSLAGVKFFLTEDLDYSKIDASGNLIATINRLVQLNNLSYFELELRGSCVSGNLKTESFSIPNNHIPFRTLTLSNPDVSVILEVKDSEDNEYFEVENLSQDTVFSSFPNSNFAQDGIESNMAIIPAPYRFVSQTNIRTRQTNLQFGSGKSTNLADDGVPDPSSLSIPLYGKKTMQRFSLDPALLLDTKTLGVAPQNTSISITYRHGGGSSHNIPAGSINDVETLNILFKDGVSETDAIIMRNSARVVNTSESAGGLDRPTTEDIREMIPSARNLQSRIVTKEDLLARLYLLPNEYGRLFRASIVANPRNPLASILFIVCRDSAGKLVRAPTTLKKNVSTYLNEFRMINDAIDILDVNVVNYRVSVSIIAAPNSNKKLVARKILDKLQKLFKITKYQVGQPMVESDIINTIINVPGVLSLIELRLDSLQGIISGRGYSNASFNFSQNKQNGIYFCGPGDIFELRYPDEDILINVR